MINSLHLFSFRRRNSNSRRLRGVEKCRLKILKRYVRTSAHIRFKERTQILFGRIKPPARKTKLTITAAKSKATTTTDDDEGATSSKPARRMAKAAESEDSSVPTKPVRKTQTRAPKTRPAVSESEPELEPIVKKTTRKGRTGGKSTEDESADSTKKKTRAKRADIEEAEGEEDPLDSIDTPDEPPVPVTKGRRAARSRTTTSPEAVEKPERDEDATGKKAKKGTKPASGKVTVPPAMVTAESEGGVNKENTPSVDDEEPAVKANKTTRAKKGRKAATEEEAEVDVDVPMMTQRATRLTRARK